MVAASPAAIRRHVRRWREATVDLAPHLKRGANVVAAVVWNFGDIAPAFQQTVATVSGSSANHCVHALAGLARARDAGIPR